MRLRCVETDHGLVQKFQLAMIRLASGHPVAGVIKTIFYRKSFFGGPMSRLTQEVLCGPSELSHGERELIAAFFSKQLQCEF